MGIYIYLYTFFPRPDWYFGFRDSQLDTQLEMLYTPPVSGFLRGRLEEAMPGSWVIGFEGRDLSPPAHWSLKPGPGPGGCETCTPEAEIHEQSHRVLQRVVGQAIGLLQNVDQPEDEAILNHGCLQRAPGRKQPTGQFKLGRNFIQEDTAIARHVREGPVHEILMGRNIPLSDPYN